MSTVRDYIRGWVEHHATDGADIEGLVDLVCEEVISGGGEDLPLTDGIRAELDEKLGTKEAKDSLTPIDVVRQELEEDLSEACAREVAPTYTSLLIQESENPWGYRADTDLPRMIAQSFRLLVQKELTEEIVERLRAEC